MEEFKYFLPKAIFISEIEVENTAAFTYFLIVFGLFIKQKLLILYLY